MERKFHMAENRCRDGIRSIRLALNDYVDQSPRKIPTGQTHQRREGKIWKAAYRDGLILLNATERLRMLDETEVQ